MSESATIVVGTAARFTRDTVVRFPDGDLYRVTSAGPETLTVRRMGWFARTWWRLKAFVRSLWR